MYLKKDVCQWQAEICSLTIGRPIRRVAVSMACRPGRRLMESYDMLIDQKRPEVPRGSQYPRFPGMTPRTPPLGLSVSPSRRGIR